MKIAVTAVLAALVVAGCARDGALRCPDPEMYAGARTIEPYTVPEGMTRPSERRRQRIPEGSGVVPEDLRGDRWIGPDGVARCLDQPPPMREDIRGR